MIREIGSEFWTDCTPLNGSGIAPLMPQSFTSKMTLSGRTGLEIIISDILAEQKRRLKVYMPSYCCHTMIEPFVSHGVEVVFYDVTIGEKGIEKHVEEDNDSDIVFLIDYFGFIDDETERIAKSQMIKGKNIIYDSTHSFFCKDIKYDCFNYVFGSFRKWMGVNAGFCSKKGAWLYNPELVQNNNYIELRNHCFDIKASFMSGSQMDKRIFLKGFECAEEGLATEYRNFTADANSLETIKHVNVEFLRNQRRKNAKMIISSLGVSRAGIGSMYADLSEQDCPLFVPLVIDKVNRAELRTWMKKQSCYLPIHWPVSDLHSLNEETSYLYITELSCVCDQRYSEEDITKLTKLLKEYS